MLASPRHVHIRRRFGQVKPSQLPSEPSCMVWLDAGLAASHSINGICPSDP